MTPFRALLHPEAMLLVHDREPQLGDLHLGLEQGVRADHDRRLSRLEPAADRAALRGGRSSRERQHLSAGAAHETAERSRVLACQDLGGHEKRHLQARLERMERGEQSHHGLAAPHVAHEQPVHRP